MGPQDVQGIMQILEALQSAEARGKAPPGSYQRALAEMEGQIDYSLPGYRSNDGFTGRIDGEVTRAPWRGEGEMGGNFEGYQRMANSMAEDAAMRESMRYSRRRREDEPEGTYALSRYPGDMQNIQRVEQGFGGQGYRNPMLANMSQDERKAHSRGRKDWARHQRKLLGIEEALGYEEVWGKQRPTSDRMRRYEEEWGY